MLILIYFFVFNWINNWFVCKGMFFRVIIEKVWLKLDKFNIFRLNYVGIVNIKECFFYIIFLFVYKIFYVIDEGVYVSGLKVLLFF